MTNANFEQGQSTSEQEGSAPMWGAPLDQAHTRREYAGFGQLEYNTRRQPHMGDELLRQAGNLQQPQYEHTIAVMRGMPGKADAPDGTPRATGRIKAVQAYGLGGAYARPGPSAPDPLDKYQDARAILQPSGYGSGFPREHEGSQFQTMGTDILAPFLAQQDGRATR